MRLIIINDTALKQSTQQSSQLPPEAFVKVADGTEFQINGYTSESGHYKVFLTDPFEGKRTWYVYALHAEIAYGVDEKFYMRVAQDTYLKQETKQADELSDANKYKVTAPDSFNLMQYFPDPAAAQHLKVKLEQPINGIITWYAFGPHVEIFTRP
ncbi:MAG: hypothetical protein ACTS2F_03580 [Thainema sp.]